VASPEVAKVVRVVAPVTPNVLDAVKVVKAPVLGVTLPIGVLSRVVAFKVVKEPVLGVVAPMVLLLIVLDVIVAKVNVPPLAAAAFVFTPVTIWSKSAITCVASAVVPLVSVKGRAEIIGILTSYTGGK
jgi:hypothetical protein